MSEMTTIAIPCYESYLFLGEINRQLARCQKLASIAADDKLVIFSFSLADNVKTTLTKSCS